MGKVVLTGSGQWAQLNISSSGVSSIYLFLVTHYPTTRNKMETGSSAEVDDVVMASVELTFRQGGWGQHSSLIHMAQQIIEFTNVKSVVHSEILFTR